MLKANGFALEWWYSHSIMKARYLSLLVICLIGFVYLADIVCSQDLLPVATETMESDEDKCNHINSSIPSSGNLDGGITKHAADNVPFLQTSIATPDHDYFDGPVFSPSPHITRGPPLTHV